jgi:phosphoribosylglycinamide formyltransferase 1
MIEKILRIGILLSGKGSVAETIMSSSGAGKVVFVGSDVAAAGGLEKAKRFGIPTFVLNYGMIDREVRLHVKDFTKYISGIDEIADFIEKSRAIIPESIEDMNERAAWIIKRFLAENFLLYEIGRHDFDILVLDGFNPQLSAFFIDRLGASRNNPHIISFAEGDLGGLDPNFP